MHFYLKKKKKEVKRKDKCVHSKSMTLTLPSLLSILYIEQLTDDYEGVLIFPHVPKKIKVWKTVYTRGL